MKQIFVPGRGWVDAQVLDRERNPNHNFLPLSSELQTLASEMQRWDMEMTSRWLMDYMVRVGSGQSNVMEILPTDTPVKKRSFLWRVWNAFSPKQRRYRNRKLMPQPTPIRDMLWYWLDLLRYGKEHMEKPWKMEIDYHTGIYKGEE